MQTMQKNVLLQQQRTTVLHKRVMQVNFNKFPDVLEFQEILLETIFRRNFLAFSWCLCTVQRTMYLLSRHAGFKSLMAMYFLFSIKCRYNLPANHCSYCTEVLCFNFFQYPGHKWQPWWAWKAWACWKTGLYNKFNNGILPRGQQTRN